MQLQLFGPPRLVLDDGRAVTLARREAALLAWLHLEGPTPRAALAGRLWPDGGEARARTNLRQLLLRLRRQAGELLVDDGAWLALAPRVALADRPVGGRLLGTLAFDDAPDLAEWLDARRADDQRERVRMQLAAGAAALDAGELATALAAADAVLAIDATAEQAHRLRMETLHRQGDRAAAIAAWDDCRVALRQAFGIAPSATTNALGRRLLAAGEPAIPADGSGRSALPAALRRPPRLVGRDGTLATLRTAIALGHSLLLAGPGGIGKSRLLDELLEGRAGVLLASAHLGDRDDHGALLRRLLVDAMALYTPALAPLLKAEVDRLLAREATLRSPHELRRGLDAARRALEACVTGGLRLLAIDDLHHADDASLAALRTWSGPWLKDGAAGAPQLVLATRRESLSATGSSFVDTITHERALRVHELQPLDVDDVHHLLAELPGEVLRRQRHGGGQAALAQALVAGVGGNPAFVLEAVRHLCLPGTPDWLPGQALPIPATLRESVGARLHGLPAGALQLAQLAAVAEGDFTPELAAAATGRSLLDLAQPLAVLEAAQVFADGRLMHDLIAQAVHDTLPRPLVASLHRQVAERLAPANGREARVAHHLDAAGDTAAAAPWHQRAGDRARRQWLLPEAARAYERAAAAFDLRRDRVAALAAWLDAAQTRLLADQPLPARTALDAAEPLLALPEERAMWLAREGHWCHRTDARARETEVALELAALLPGCSERLSHAELGNALRVVCAAVENGAAADPLVALCEASSARMLAGPPDDAAAWAHAYGMTLHWLARPRDALHVLEAAWQRLDDRSEPSTRLGLLNQAMRVRHTLGDLPGAIADGRTLLALAERTRIGVVTECDVLHVTGTMLAAHGQAAQALACFDEIERRLAAANQPMREVFTVSRAHVSLNCGQIERARALLADIPRAIDEPLNVVYDQARWWAEARLAAAERRPVEPWRQRLAALPPLPPALELVHRVSLATLDDADAASLDALRSELAGRGWRALERTVCALAARVALSEGRAGDALPLAEGVIELMPFVDAWVDQPAAHWLTLAEVFDACGHSQRAHDVLARGARWVRDTASQWALDADRRAWLEGNAVHAALLARADAHGA